MQTLLGTTRAEGVGACRFRIKERLGGCACIHLRASAENLSKLRSSNHPLLLAKKPIETDEILVLGPPDPLKSEQELLAEDCLKGRFGGKAENDGWKITAKVDSVSEKWCRVELGVTPPPKSKDATHVTLVENPCDRRHPQHPPLA